MGEVVNIHGGPGERAPQLCDICLGNYDMAEAFAVLRMCVEHRDEFDAMTAERDLRRVLDPGFHAAHPRDLSDDLAGWDCASGLYLYGPVGTGKSHAAAAMTKRWYVHQQKLGNHPTVAWLNVPRAILDTLAEFSKGAVGNPGKLWDEATHAGLLVLDDIGVEQPKEWIRTRLYALIDYRLNQSLTTIVTSNLKLGQLADRLDSPQIASRLSQACGLVTFEGKPDRRPGLGPGRFQG